MPQIGLHTLIEMYLIAQRCVDCSLIQRSRAVSKCANVFQLCLFNSAPPPQHALGFMHKHELAFQLSPHITNLNLNEPPLQIHQQAMTLHPPSTHPSPTPYSTPPPPATHIHQQAIISRHLSEPPPIHANTHLYPFLPQPHQLHSTHLIKRGRTGRRRNGGGSLYQDDFLR